MLFPRPRRLGTATDRRLGTIAIVSACQASTRILLADGTSSRSAKSLTDVLREAVRSLSGRLQQPHGRVCTPADFSKRLKRKHSLFHAARACMAVPAPFNSVPPVARILRFRTRSRNTRILIMNIHPPFRSKMRGSASCTTGSA